MATFMNEYDVDRMVERFDHDDQPVLWSGAMTLQALMHWTNNNSDGWPYWQKPQRAAARLIDLLRDATERPYDEQDDDIPLADLRKALIPLKSFLTKQFVEHGDVIHLNEQAPEPVSSNDRRYADRGFMGDLPQAVHDAAMTYEKTYGERAIGYKVAERAGDGSITYWMVVHERTYTWFTPGGTAMRQGMLHQFIRD